MYKRQPLLFLHGDADVNVPVGESIQMFTALKLLGRETAFVAVTGQDHHIVDYGKRIQWQNTIFAWFAKLLQDDATWWNAIYKPKNLDVYKRQLLLYSHYIGWICRLCRRNC